jgi:hypothetical protein
MASSINTYNINKIYDTWQSRGSDCAPRSGAKELSPVLPLDRVTLSKQALGDRADQRQSIPGLSDEQNLSEDQKQQVKELKKRDADVKSHEQAHMASGGGLVQGGASFEYQNGPDGRMYAVGGEVKIDMSPERTPEATIRKMQQVRRAALAPAEPSGTDRAVAAQASQIETQARAELSEKNRPYASNGDDTAPSSTRAAGASHGYAPNGDAAAYQPGGQRIDLII